MEEIYDDYTKDNKNKKIFVIVGIIILIVIVGLGIFVRMKGDFSLGEKKEYKDISSEFNINLIKNVNKLGRKNYLVSPYSIELALNLVKTGADGNTYKELESVLPNRKIADLNGDKIHVANAAFIKDIYKDAIEEKYVAAIKNNYNADILYDKFTSPAVINDWVKNKTDGAIKKISDNVSKDFVLGLANAITIDVEWEEKFMCNSTKSAEFTTDDNKKVNVEMMHNTYKDDLTSYFKDDTSEGIIIPYKEYNGNRLEFVGILPQNGINSYIDSLTTEKLNNIKGTVVSDNYNIINVSVPRFTYDFELGDNKDFIKVLKDMGIKEMFDSKNANLKKMVNLESIRKVSPNTKNVYVNQAIHKTHIEFSEKGTKAAAVTAVYLERSSSLFPNNEIKYYNIEFNKSFIYMIRDSKSKEILFFGTVNEPNLWKGSTCK